MRTCDWDVPIGGHKNGRTFDWVLLTGGHKMGTCDLLPAGMYQGWVQNWELVIGMYPQVGTIYADSGYFRDSVIPNGGQNIRRIRILLKQ